MFTIRIISILLVINHVICRPTGFAALNEIIYNNPAQYDLQQMEEHDSQHAQAQQVPTQSSTNQPESTNQPKSLFEEYPWLDNALALLSDKFIRLLGLLIKKFIFKMDVNVAEVF